MAMGKITRVYPGKGKKTYGNPKKSSYKSASIRKIVKKELRKNTEVKRKQFNWDEASVSTLNQSPDTWRRDITTLTQGLTKENRIGNEVKVIGVQIKGICKSNSTGSNYMRLILYKPRNVSETADSTLLEYNDDVPITTGATGLNAMYFSTNKESIVVLYDRVFRMAPSNNYGDTQFFNIFKKLNNKCKYTTSATAEATQGAIRVAAFAAEAGDDTGTGTVVELSAVISLYFTDL